MNPEEQALLQQMNDIVTPGQPGWWPLAPAWWVLAFIGVVLFVMLYLSFKKQKDRRQQIHWRDSALAEHKRLSANLLSALDDEHAVHAWLAQLSVLMRRVALAVLPRRQIAGLTDDQWLDTLNAIGNTNEYTQGVGQIMYRMPYRRNQTIAAADIEHLLDLTRETIFSAHTAELQQAVQPQMTPQRRQQPEHPQSPEQPQSREAGSASF